MKARMIFCAVAALAAASLVAATGGTPVVPVAGKMPATPVLIWRIRDCGQGANLVS